MAKVEHLRRAPEGLISELNLSVGKAVEIRDTVLSLTAGLIGVVAIADRKGMLLSLQVTGDGLRDMNVPLVLGKLKTVVASQRSTRLQRERMLEAGIDLANYGGELGNLFGGGVAAFNDKDRTEFVGAVAYSGGPEDQDEQVCVEAIEMAGLFTDIPKKVEEPSI